MCPKLSQLETKFPFANTMSLFGIIILKRFFIYKYRNIGKKKWALQFFIKNFIKRKHLAPIF